MTREENVLSIARRILERRVLVSEETQLADAVERMAAALRGVVWIPCDNPSCDSAAQRAVAVLRELGIPLVEAGDE